MNWVLLLFLFIALALFFVRDKMKFPGKGSVPDVILYGIFGGLILLSLSRSVREGFSNVQPADSIFDRKVLLTSPMPSDTGDPQVEVLFWAERMYTDEPTAYMRSSERDRCRNMKGFVNMRDTGRMVAYRSGNSIIQGRQSAEGCMKDCTSDQQAIYDADWKYQGCKNKPRSKLTDEQRSFCSSQNGEISEKITNKTIYLNAFRSYQLPYIQEQCLEKCPEGSETIQGNKCKVVNAVPKQRDGTCPGGFQETLFDKSICVPLMEVPRKVMGNPVRGAPGPDGRLMCPDGGYEVNEQEGTCVKFEECPAFFRISKENPFVCSFTGNMSTVKVLDRIPSNQEQLALSSGNTSNVACPVGYILDPQNPEYCVKVA